MKPLQRWTLSRTLYSGGAGATYAGRTTLVIAPLVDHRKGGQDRGDGTRKNRRDRNARRALNKGWGLQRSFMTCSFRTLPEATSLGTTILERQDLRRESARDRMINALYQPKWQT